MVTFSRGILLAVWFAITITGIAMVAGTVTANAPVDFPDCGTVGYDTDGDGYHLVTNVTQLQCVGEDHADAADKNAALGMNYRLAGDIDASDTANWDESGGESRGFDPIGDSGNPFSGTFDGDGNRIEGLYINRSDENRVGLFGFVDSDGVISAVGVERATVSGQYLVGGLVGENEGDVNASYVTGETDGKSNVGGLIGTNEGTVENSSATSAVNGAGTTSIGGLIGRHHGGHVTNSFAAGDVTADEHVDYVGGLIGYQFNDAAVVNAYAVGSVTTSEGGDGVGGLIGRLDSSSVDTAYATGNVTTDEDASNVGGLVGHDWWGDSTVERSYWDVNATSQDSSAVLNSERGLTTEEMTGDHDLDDGPMDDFASSTWLTQDAEENWGYIVPYPTLETNPQVPPPGIVYYAGGNGTAENPYQIGDWHHLDNVRENLDAEFELAADLNESTAGYEVVAGVSANDGNGFEPIGEFTDEFEGTFNGEGYTISGLTINRPASRAGLFGILGSDAVVERVSLKDVDVTGGQFTGGLVGENAGDVKRSSAAGEIDGSANQVGGLVGYNLGTVEQSYATGNVEGAFSYVGGLVGQNTGDVEHSYATGDIDGSANQVGGLAGSNEGEVHASYSTGDVEGDSRVGGLIGWNTGEVNQTYANGAVAGDSDVGGLVGSSSADIEDSYWDVETSETATGIGVEGDINNATGLFTMKMTGDRTLGNMDGFDFKGTWEITPDTSGNGQTVYYPTLQSNTQDPAPHITLDDDDGGGSSTPASPSRNVVTIDSAETVDSHVQVLRPDPTESIRVGGGADEPTISGVGNVSVDGMILDVTTRESFAFGVSTYEADLTPSVDADNLDPEAVTRVEDAATAFEAETGTVSAGYVSVDHDLEPEDLSSVTFEFSVRTAYLDDIGVDPHEVELYRKEADGWTPQSTDHVNTTETHHYFEGTTPGFSVFAIGTDAPRIDAIEAIIDDDQITNGEMIAIRATVENRGLSAGDHTALLLVDGEEADAHTVALDGGQSTEITFSFEPSAPGEYELAVGDLQPELVTVVEPKEGSNAVFGHDPAEVEVDDSESSWLYIVSIAMLGTGLIVLGSRWRRKVQQRE